MSLRERGWIIRGLAMQSSGLSIALSLAFFLSKPIRLSASAYWGIVNTGGSVTWGVVFLLAGLSVAFSSWHGLRPLRIALGFTAICYSLLTLAFASAAFNFPNANLTAPVVYGAVVYAHVFAMLLITCKLQKRPYDTPECQ